MAKTSSPLIKIATWLLGDPVSTNDENHIDFWERQNLSKAINEAKMEWLNAKSYFDNISEPDLVDYAIYCLEAAERKYMFLLNKLKEGETPPEPLPLELG